MSAWRHRDCAGCRDLLRQLDVAQDQLRRLQRENARLRQALGRQRRTSLEQPFGAATPPSKQLVKPGATAANRARRGGARPRHPGHGRHRFAAAAVTETVALPPPDCCPACGGPLQPLLPRARDVLDVTPPVLHRRRYTFARCQCAACGRLVQPRVPGVLPHSHYSNGLISYLATEHYLHGVPMGRLAARLPLPQGNLCGVFHRLAQQLREALPRLEAELRRAPVVHADETPWRTDGANGYAWGFFTPTTQRYCLRLTRSGQVAREVLGTAAPDAVLVVDRYGGYNVVVRRRQFCFAHLRTNLKDVEAAHPAHPEVAACAAGFHPLLAAAMHLPALHLEDAPHYARAQELQTQLEAAAARPARHPAVQAYQNIFRREHDRLFLWVTDRRIPCENNTAERALRRIVIARKLSGGSQSADGAYTREILMSVLHTLALRGPDPRATLTQALDQLATHPDANLAVLLFPPTPSPGPAPPASLPVGSPRSPNTS